ncbi:MAG: hypothetical protein ACI8ZB_002349 [Desulforhopalus sp.]|jgi:hypothetical protein
MSILPDVIVYLWLIPLSLYVVIPLSMLGINALSRLMHFMFNPARPKVKRDPSVPEAHLQKAS